MIIIIISSSSSRINIIVCSPLPSVPLRAPASSPLSPLLSPYRRLRKEALLLHEPWPCNPEAATFIHPPMWCLNTYFRTCLLLWRSWFIFTDRYLSLPRPLPPSPSLSASLLSPFPSISISLSLWLSIIHPLAHALMTRVLWMNCVSSICSGICLSTTRSSYCCFFTSVHQFHSQE